MHRKFGIGEQFTLQNIYDEFKHGSRISKKYSDEITVVAVKRMCKNTKIIRKVGDKYEFVSEESFDENVSSILRKKNDARKMRKK